MTNLNFRPITGLTNWVTLLLAALLAVSLVSAVSGFTEIALLERMRDGGVWTDAELEANDLRVTVISLTYLVLVVAEIIVFMLWIYRVSANLLPLGISDPSWGPGWSVGVWFIPFLNWFVPFQIVREIWKASAPDADAVDWRGRSAPAFLWIWWLAHIASNILDAIAARSLRSEPETIEAYIEGSELYIVNDVIAIPAGILTILVVRGICRRQTERSRGLFDESRETNQTDGSI